MYAASTVLHRGSSDLDPSDKVIVGGGHCCRSRGRVRIVEMSVSIRATVCTQVQGQGKRSEGPGKHTGQGHR